MRITIEGKAREGHVLALGLMVSLIMGIVLAGYLRLVSSVNLSTYRSQAWNSALPVAEAGVEEALAHLNQFAIDGWIYDLESPIEQVLGLIHGRHTNSWGSRGWTLDDGWYVKQRSVGDAYFIAKISNAMPPVIVSEGYVKGVLSTNYLSPRVIRAQTKLDRLFARAMVAEKEIDLQGSTVKTDSFDSSDPNHSTNGRYDPAKAKDNGDVATNSILVDSFYVGNAKIRGRVATGPGGTIAIGSEGKVGSGPWHTSGVYGVEPGYSSDDMNVYFPDVKEPFSGGYSVPTSGTVDGVTYNYVLNDGNYKLGELKMSGEQDMLVNGQAILLIENNLSLSGEASIIVADNASLRLFVKGTTASIGGAGVSNPSNDALHFYYLGLPTNKEVSIKGGAGFTGIIYAPQALLTLSGGGTVPYDFVGASITESVKMNGEFQFHYDEFLGAFGPDRGFIVIDWNEVNWVEVSSY